MRIGIIIHSHTGNTLSVARRLQEKLLAEGHFADLDRVEAVDENPSAAGNVQLKMSPEVTDYDEIIFGAPVRGFSLSPVMKVYLSQLSSLKDKRVGCFVTQYFPYPWMGGNRAIKKMEEICQAKGGYLFERGIINWSHKKREDRISEVLGKLGKVEIITTK